MIEKILTPVEVGDQLGSHVNAAIHFAKNFESKLLLLQSSPRYKGEFVLGGQVVDESVVQAFDAMKVRETTMIQLHANPEVQTLDYELVVKSGNNFSRASDQIDETNPDLVVIGCEDSAKLEGFFNSNLRMLSPKSNFPILIVPKNYHYHSIKKIGLALDVDSTYDEIPYKDLLAWVDEYEATLDIIHIHNGTKKEVIDAENSIYPVIRDKMFINGIDDYTFRTVLERDAKKGISKMVDHSDVDLLVMTYRNQGFFERLFNPEVRKQMIGDSQVPILILK